MNSSDFNKFIEDFSSIDSSNSSNFERILRKYSYFQTAALFLAKSNLIQENTQRAALRSADRRVLRTWLDEDYRKELEKDKQEVEVLSIENNESDQNLDIDTESINAFDKLVETDMTKDYTAFEEKENVKSEELPQEIEDNQYAYSTNFFDEVEDNRSNENDAKKSIFKQQSDINEPLINSPISEIPPTTTDANFFDEMNEDEFEEPIYKEQSDINEPLFASIPAETTDANFFEDLNDDEFEEPIYKEQSDINEPLFASIPAETTDANFFDDVYEDESDQLIFKEQSDINEPLLTSTPSQTADANFFQEVNENESDQLIFKEQSDINEPLVTSILKNTTEANFFDEIESDDEIFEDSQKDLDNYGFPDFEDEKEEMEKNKKANEADGNFFDDI